MANVNNYIAAGQSSVRKNLKARQALADNKADYGVLGEEKIKADRDIKVARIKAAAEVKNAQTKAEMLVKTANIEVGADKAIDKAKRGIRKAGVLAAGVKSIAAANYLNNKKTETNEQLSLIEQQLSSYDKRIADLKGKEGELRKATQALTTNSANNSTDTDTDSSTSASQISDSGAASTSGSLNLSDNDFKELAYAVSSEAALGTDDEFGVAANIITRLKSGKYGSSISEIIRAPGQYEGVYTGRSKYSPEIQSRLQSPEGQAKITDFITKLDGRTEFKGQTMLHNRVKAEDPMFDPSGNFYHYAGQ